VQRWRAPAAGAFPPFRRERPSRFRCRYEAKRIAWENGVDEDWENDADDDWIDVIGLFGFGLLLVVLLFLAAWMTWEIVPYTTGLNNGRGMSADAQAIRAG
jgi:hypothetical protein